MGYLTANATPLSELYALRAGSWGEVKAWSYGLEFFYLFQPPARLIIQAVTAAGQSAYPAVESE